MEFSSAWRRDDLRLEIEPLGRGQTSVDLSKEIRSESFVGAMVGEKFFGRRWWEILNPMQYLPTNLIFVHFHALVQIFHSTSVWVKEATNLPSFEYGGRGQYACGDFRREIWERGELTSSSMKSLQLKELGGVNVVSDRELVVAFRTIEKWIPGSGGVVNERWHRKQSVKYQTIALSKDAKMFSGSK